MDKKEILNQINKLNIPLVKDVVKLTELTLHSTQYITFLNAPQGRFNIHSQ